jgi:hypothetical protein
MKRKIISLVLALLLFSSLIETASADNSGICFSATNDTLQDLGSMAVYSGGAAYVPGKIFTSLSLYFIADDKTAILFDSKSTVTFDLVNGGCSDNLGASYSTTAIYKSGQVYVPASWVCSYFNLKYSPITGIGYGDVIRITNSKAVLSNQQFLDAATSLMHSHYNDYFGVNTTVTPSTSPSPSPSPTTNTDGTQKAANLSLCFIGLPSKEILDSLDAYSFKACFFVTAEEAKSSPDIIRRICGSGHSIGIYCKSSAQNECVDAVNAIFEAAQERPVLITSHDSISKSCIEYAKANGFAYFSPKILFTGSVKYAYIVTSKLENAKGYVTVSIYLDEYTENALPSILKYVTSKSFKVSALRETNV